MKIYTTVENEVELDIVHQFVEKMNPEYPYDIGDDAGIDDDQIDYVHMNTDADEMYVIHYNNSPQRDYYFVDFKTFLVTVYEHYNKLFIDGKEVLFDDDGVTVGCTFVSKETINQIAEQFQD